MIPDDVAPGSFRAAAWRLRLACTDLGRAFAEAYGLDRAARWITSRLRR